MKRIESILIIFLFISSVLWRCSSRNREMAFDKEKWAKQTDPAFPSPFRSRMATDLTTNHKLVGLKYSQLVDLLGIPDYNDSSSLTYKVIVNYGYDIDPIYTKNLDFVFSKDSIITSFKFDEWKKK